MFSANHFKRVYYLGMTAYAGMFVLSILFYKERSIFGDNALELFLIIKDKWFPIQNYRFGAAMTQVWPLVATVVQLKLKTILLISSISFILYYFACYLICGIVLNNYRIAVVLVLSQVLFVTHTCYSVQSELPQGLALMMVVFAYVARPNVIIHPLFAILLTVAVITTAFFHPLIAFPMSFCTVFLLLTRDAAPKKLLYFIAGIFITAIIIKNTAFATGYDNSAMSSGINAVGNIGHFFSLPSLERFIHACRADYYFIPVSALAIISAYILARCWSKLTLFLIFFFGYISMISLTYGFASITATYFENLYLPLGVILAVPLVYDVFPLFSNYKFTLGITLLVITLCIIRIFNTHEIYSRRLNWERAFLKKTNGQKLLVSDKKVPMDTLQFSWATPYEFCFLSTLENGQSSSIYIADDINRFDDAETRWDTKALLTPWGPVDYDKLPKTYFNFSDTLNRYTVVR